MKIKKRFHVIAAAKNVVELFEEKEWKSEQFNFNLKLKKERKKD